MGPVSIWWTKDKRSLVIVNIAMPYYICVCVANALEYDLHGQEASPCHYPIQHDLLAVIGFIPEITPTLTPLLSTKQKKCDPHLHGYSQRPL